MIDRSKSAEVADVLLVEPSDELASLTRDGLSDGGGKTNVHVVSDGDEAIAFLEQREPHAHAPVPCLVVLRADLPAPGPDGIGVLESMADRTELVRIPVIVTVDTPSDAFVREAYDLGANAVVPTSDDSDTYLETIERTSRFWIATARLPNRIDRL